MTMDTNKAITSVRQLLYDIRDRAKLDGIKVSSPVYLLEQLGDTVGMELGEKKP